jgi:hypothetical protein
LKLKGTKGEIMNKTTLMTAALVAGLVAAKTARAEDTAAHAKDAKEGAKVEGEKNSCKGEKNSCKGKDKNSCKGKKKHGKNSCKNGCKGEKAEHTEAPAAAPAAGEHK